MPFLLKLLVFTLYLSLSYHIIDASVAATVHCPSHNLNFQKVIGYRPNYKFLSLLDLSHSTLRFQQEYQPSIRCYEFCHDNAKCLGVVYKISSSQCYGLYWNNRESVTDEGILDMTMDSDTIYYQKTCFKVPQYCSKKFWPVTRIPGSLLVADDYHKIQNRLVTRSECIEACLSDTREICRSVKFLVSYKNNQNRFGSNTVHNHEDIGECFLSKYNKNILPGSYRTGPIHEEYIENLCHDEHVTESSDDCSFEVFNDSKFLFADMEYIKPTEVMGYRECQHLCLNETRFYCLGSSLKDQAFVRFNIEYSVCSLHSEDLISLGPRSIVSTPGTLYIRRVECLNITVNCHANDMLITYTPLNEKLSGRIFLQPEMDKCVIQRKYQSSSLLTMRIGNENEEKKCGILRGYRAEKYNEVMVFTHIRIRSNPAIEKQGDRLIKVGCIYYNLTNSVPSLLNNFTIGSNNFSIGSSIAFGSKEHIPNTASSHYNESGIQSPDIYLEIVDATTQQEVNDVQIGQMLEFRIILKSSHLNNKDYRAVNLYTQSEDNRRMELLLDSHGCPVDQSIFPGLQKTRVKYLQIFSARFNAFQFPDSSRVKFSVTMKLCYKDCPNNCDDYARRTKRDSPIIKGTDSGSGIIFAKNTEKSPSETAEYVGVSSDMDTFKRDVKSEKQIAYDSRELYKTYPSQVLGNYDESNQQGNISQITRNDFTDNKRILSEKNEIPLEININVHKSDKTSTDRLINGENSDQILIAGLAPEDDDTFCINKSLLISFLILIIILQIVLLAICCYFIRRYKKYADNENDRHSLHQIQHSLDFDNYNRRVHWADQNYNTQLFYT